MKAVYIWLILMILAATMAIAEPIICPMDEGELYRAGQMVMPHHQAIIMEGRQTSDGRRFLKGLDLNLFKMCLYVINPDGKVERYEYKQKVQK